MRRAGRRRGRRAAGRVGGRRGRSGRVDVDAVLVGFHRNFDFERMRIAATAVRRGARLIATNDDATYPTPDGPIPGGGAILASVATATRLSGRSSPASRTRRWPRRCATLLGDAADGQLLMVGDRASTDGAFAVAIGCPFALVRTGVTLPGEAGRRAGRHRRRSTSPPSSTCCRGTDGPSEHRRRRASWVAAGTMPRWPRTPCNSCSRRVSSSVR